MSEALSYVPANTEDEPSSHGAAADVAEPAGDGGGAIPASPEASEAEASVDAPAEAARLPFGKLALVSSEAPRRSSRPLIVLLVVVAVVALGLKVAPGLLREDKPATGPQAVPLGYVLGVGDGRTFELTTTTTASIIGVGPGKDQTDRTVLKGQWRVRSNDTKTALIEFVPASYAYQINGGRTVTLQQPDLGLRARLWKTQRPPEGDEAIEAGDWTLGKKLVIRPPMEETFVPYGIKRAAPGQSWEIPQTITEPVFGQKMKPVFRYTLSGEAPARDRRTITGSLSMPLGFILSPQETAKRFGWADDPGLANLVQARVLGSLYYDATFEVDTRTGAVLEMRGTYNIIVRVKLDRVDVPAMTFVAGIDFEYRSPKAIKAAKTA